LIRFAGSLFSTLFFLFFMKKQLFSGLLGGWMTCLVVYSAHACDICGSAMGGSQTGVLALSQRHLAGVRWQSQAFESRPHGSGLGAREQFRTAELWGRWQVHPRVQVQAQIPWHVNSRQLGESATQVSNGLGDIVLLSQFALFSNQKQAMRRWQHQVLLGGGAKLPTGQTRIADATGTRLHSNVQPGTGSTDWLLTAMYALRHDQWGVSAEYLLRRNGTNSEGYHFGHRTASTLRVFRLIPVGQALLVPQVGASRDRAQRDYDGPERLSESGGHAWYAQLGGDLFLKKIAFGVSVQMPLRHDLAQGYVTPAPRWQASVTCFLGKSAKPALPPVQVPVPKVFFDVKQTQSNS
jgi:hypothetical protein